MSTQEDTIAKLNEVEKNIDMINDSNISEMEDLWQGCLIVSREINDDGTTGSFTPDIAMFCLSMNESNFGALPKEVSSIEEIKERLTAHIQSFYIEEMYETIFTDRGDSVIVRIRQLDGGTETNSTKEFMFFQNSKDAASFILEKS